MGRSALQPKRHVLAAWLAGGIAYLCLAMGAMAEAGGIALPVQIIFGSVVSLILVGLAALTGLLLRLPWLRMAWCSTAIPSVILLLSAAALLFFGSRWSVTSIVVTEETGETYRALEPWTAFGAMFAVVFAILHFPLEPSVPRISD